MSGPNIRRLYHSASEIAEALQIKPYLLTSWESQFPQLRPMLRGGRRLFTPSDYRLICEIKRLKDLGYSTEEIKETLSPARMHPSTEESSHGGEILKKSDERAAIPWVAEIIQELEKILQLLQ